MALDAIKLARTGLETSGACDKSGVKKLNAGNATSMVAAQAIASAPATLAPPLVTTREGEKQKSEKPIKAEKVGSVKEESGNKKWLAIAMIIAGVVFAVLAGLNLYFKVLPSYASFAAFEGAGALILSGAGLLIYEHFKNHKVESLEKKPLLQQPIKKLSQTDKRGLASKEGESIDEVDPSYRRGAASKEEEHIEQMDPSHICTFRPKIDLPRALGIVEDRLVPFSRAGGQNAQLNSLQGVQRQRGSLILSKEALRNMGLPAKEGEKISGEIAQGYHPQYGKVRYLRLNIPSAALGVMLWQVEAGRKPFIYQSISFQGRVGSPQQQRAKKYLAFINQYMPGFGFGLQRSGSAALPGRVEPVVHKKKKAEENLPPLPKVVPAAVVEEDEEFPSFGNWLVDKAVNKAANFALACTSSLRDLMRKMMVQSE